MHLFHNCGPHDFLIVTAALISPWYMENFLKILRFKFPLYLFRIVLELKNENKDS